MKVSALNRMFLLVLILAAAVPAVAQEEPAAAAPRVTAAVGTSIDRETRTPLGVATSFTAAGDTLELWCWTLVENLEAPTTVTHAWFHEDHSVGTKTLDIGSNWYRTWSSKTILPDKTGMWEVKVLDAAGTVLGTTSFEIR